MKPYLKYGLIAAAVSIVFSLIVSYGNLKNTSFSFALNLLTYGTLAIVTFFAIREVRFQQGNYLRYNQGVVEGLKVAVIAGLLTTIAHYIDAKWLNHDVTETLYAKMEEELESRSMSEEEMVMAMDWGKKMLTPGGQAIMVFIGYILLGLVISLIAAAILRKDNRSSSPFQ